MNNSYNLFDRVEDLMLDSMNKMHNELCEKASCEECGKYPNKCTYKERENKIKEAFDELKTKLDILINGNNEDISEVDSININKLIIWLEGQKYIYYDEDKENWIEYGSELDTSSRWETKYQWEISRNRMINKTINTLKYNKKDINKIYD